MCFCHFFFIVLVSFANECKVSLGNATLLLATTKAPGISGVKYLSKCNTVHFCPLCTLTEYQGY